MGTRKNEMSRAQKLEIIRMVEQPHLRARRMPGPAGHPTPDLPTVGVSTILVADLRRRLIDHQHRAVREPGPNYHSIVKWLRWRWSDPSCRPGEPVVC